MLRVPDFLKWIYGFSSVKAAVVLRRCECLFTEKGEKGEEKRKGERERRGSHPMRSERTGRDLLNNDATQRPLFHSTEMTRTGRLLALSEGLW